MFQSRRPVFLVLTFKSMTLFKLTCVCGVRQGPSFVLLMYTSSRPLHLLTRLLFPHCTILAFLTKNQFNVNVWVYFQVPNSIPLIYFVPMPMPHSLSSCSGVVSFELGRYEFSSFVLLFQDHLPIQSLSHFCINFRISMSISAKAPTGTLTGRSANLQITLVGVAIVTILSFNPCILVRNVYLFVQAFFSLLSTVLCSFQ